MDYFSDHITILRNGELSGSTLFQKKNVLQETCFRLWKSFTQVELNMPQMSCGEVQIDFDDLISINAH
jgi:hypothetical protein